MIEVGIDKIALHIPKYYVDMTKLAVERKVDPNKYLKGIGQDKMAVPPIEQDIVAMGATAAYKILEKADKNKIDQVIFATESGIDFSKSAATYIHELLEIQPNARSYEIKHACYGGTAALLAACDYIRLRPERKVLVISSDVARYGLYSSGEPTQGAGAIAMLISAKPRVMSIDFDSISLTDNQFDFWRPNFSDVPLVEGKFSTELYINMFVKVMLKMEQRFPERLQEIETFAFHLPFTKMGLKALNGYKEMKETEIDSDIKETLLNKWLGNYNQSTILSRQVGNMYTGSLYLSLISMLIYNEDLQAGARIGLFSYGSGAVAEIFTGKLLPTYKAFILKENIESHLSQREEIDIETYEKIHNTTIKNEDALIKIVDKEPIEGGFYLSQVDHYRRYYDFTPITR